MKRRSLRPTSKSKKPSVHVFEEKVKKEWNRITRKTARGRERRRYGNKRKKGYKMDTKTYFGMGVGWIFCTLPKQHVFRREKNACL
jgi:hypothetical protein